MNKEEKMSPSRKNIGESSNATIPQRHWKKQRVEAAILSAQAENANAVVTENENAVVTENANAVVTESGDAVVTETANPVVMEKANSSKSTFAFAIPKAPISMKSKRRKKNDFKTSKMMSLSPRVRTFSDSMDYDDELAELHDKRERQLRLAASGSGVENRFIRDDSDEDTEDASEDGDVEHQEIKEQVYYDKLGLLKANLEELEAGNHIEYNRQLCKIDLEYEERKQLNQVWYDNELECIEKDYSNERLVIVREFEEKKIELRESLIAELEEKKKHLEQERFSMELTSDPTEVKPMSTRKLRRRPNEPVPVPEKRRKTPQSQITFLLDDKEMEEDLKAIAKKKVPEGAYGHNKKLSKLWNSNNSSTSSASEHSDHASETQAPDYLNSKARFQDGKLFYEKRWFHRGQPVYVEGKDLQRSSCIISSIGQDNVWVRKVNEQAKIRIPIVSLQKGKMIIKRRA